MRTSLITARDKITPGLLGGAKLKGLLDNMITKWDTRTQHVMEKDQAKIARKVNKLR